MPKCECCESRKNKQNDIWLNPKCYIMDNQQLRLEQSKVQRSEWKLVGDNQSILPKWWESYTEDYDMICTRMKVRGYFYIAILWIDNPNLSVIKKIYTIQNDCKEVDKWRLCVEFIVWKI